MTTETYTVAMTDPQLTNNNNNNTNNNNNNNNNNNDGEPKYLHKKFKKMATTEVTPKVEPKKESGANTGSLETPKKKDTIKEPTKVAAEASPDAENEPTESRKSGYVCPYCKLSCAKPSVLQKHIRAHTNERPYPCVPCGFAFKTKSNLYKHCRSRAHALKMEGGDTSKVSEDSDISLSDSASNGTGTPPPPPAASTPATVQNASVKTVKTGKIYKPKFHTALQCVNNDTETSSLSSSSSNSSSSTTAPLKPKVEQVQEHIDKIITDNQAIVDAVDPRLHKLMLRQQSLVDVKPLAEEPLNLSSGEESSTRKRCYSDSYAQEGRDACDGAQGAEGSIIKDLLLKNRGSNLEDAGLESGDSSFVCPSCNIPYSSIDNLEAHRRYYCNGVTSPRRAAEGYHQSEVEKKDGEFESKSSDYYGSLQPLTSPGPLLGNTRLVDPYAPPPLKKQKSDSVPTTLRSLEELSKYPRPNSLQMFGGEVRILDNTGETKTMRIEPRQTNSPASEHIVVSSKCVSSETASIVVRSGLHSGGTMVHKPPGNAPVVSTPSCSSITMPNAPKMLAPIIPNISTPSIAPTMSCYSYLEPHLNPLTSITAYNPLTLPQTGIASILHGGKVIPYVPGMPGPHMLTAAPPALDISPSMVSGDAGYKVIPGLPGLHMIPQPLDLASPVKIPSSPQQQHPPTPQPPPNVPGIPGPISSSHTTILGQPLDLVSSAKDAKQSFKASCGNGDGQRAGLTSPKVPSVKVETSVDASKYRGRFQATTPTSADLGKVDLDRHIKSGQTTKYKSIESPQDKRELLYDRSPKLERTFDRTYSNGVDTANMIGTSTTSYSKLRSSPKAVTPENRKRPSSWSVNELEVSGRGPIDSPASSGSTSKYDSSPPHENGRLNFVGLPEHGRTKVIENYSTVNGAKMRADSMPPVILVNTDSSKTEVPNKASVEQLVVKTDKSEMKLKDCDNDKEETNASKFLRPTSLPLKPGTFTPKKHHGITPTANTLPLISPETPRPKKSYGQLYLNGHAYTYLGLKCSTRVFYCTLNRPQPMYVTQQHGLSMYSNWKVCKEAPPDVDMAHYDSRHRPLNYTTAWKKQEDILTHSSQRPTTPTSPDSGLESDMQEKAKRVKIFDGGFESNEDYTYVRGRGRGRYVCEECGIRCKKPSMLKKHIRTHTDVRPYTCKHCAFSFKTKGNLTKHMKSKAHYKKCVELGVVPVPTTVCDENIDKDAIARLAAGGNTEDSSSEEEETDGEESEESGSEEQEAAQSLLSLSQRNSSRLPGLLPSRRPTTYPYTLTFPATSVTANVISTTVTTTTAITSQNCNTHESTIVQSEHLSRYYFPSTRNCVEDTRTSVIQLSKKDDVDMDVEDVTDGDSRQQLSQPMDLTTKSAVHPLSSPIPQRAKPADILTPVSEPVLLQTIVQTMERLPIQGREWKPDAEGHMLQAYLTERHVMDSKIKQQYRVGNTKLDKHSKDRDTYLKHKDLMNSRGMDSNSIPTVTYTDPSKMQQNIVESRIKHISKHTTDDIKMEIREKIYQNNISLERRPCDFEPIYKEKEQPDIVITERDNINHSLQSPAAVRTSMEYGLSMNKSMPLEKANYPIDSSSRTTPNIDRHSPKNFNVDINNRLAAIPHANNEIDRNPVYGMKVITELDRSRDGHPVNQEIRSSNHEMKTLSTDLRMQSQSPRSVDLKPLGRDIRAHNQDYRPQSQEIRLLNQDFKMRNQELRPPSREFKTLTHDLRMSQDVAPSTNIDIRQINSDRSPGGDIRLLTEYRPPSQETRGTFEVIQSSIHESSKIQDISRSQHIDIRNSDRIEAKHTAETTKQNIADSIKYTVVRKMVVGGPGFRSPSPTTSNSKPQAEFLQPSSGPAPNYVSVTEDGRSVCGICNKVFSKPSQLRLHINIHYFERPFRCESCAVSFRTKGHLTKHERSVSHHNKVSMTSTFGAATTSNPRPFKCTDCKIAFRIHGHLAKHLRSKMHIMKLECLGKLPFGTYAEMERSGVNLNDIDTTDCDNSLASLQILAQRLCEKDPSKIGQWDAEIVPNPTVSGGETSSDEGEPIPQHTIQQYSVKPVDTEVSRTYHVPIVNEDPKSVGDIRLGNSQFNQQKREYSVKERSNQSLITDRFQAEDVRGEDNLQSYKCQVCGVSMRTVNELQVHCFVEHNIETDSSTNIHADRSVTKCREKENTHKRITDESAGNEDHSRQMVEDT